MRQMRHVIPALLALLAGCSTPYNTPVVVRDSTEFPGIASVIAQNRARPVDVVMVHGMCTHDQRWAWGTMNNILRSVAANASAPPGPVPPAAARQIQVFQRSDQVAGGTVNFHALVWSPMVSELKQQLVYDNTGTPTDCATDAQCKPKRAYFNGKLKDELLNDCLSDAMIYEGQSRPRIQQTMVDTVTRILEQADERSGNQPGPLIVVAESLGSKILFDALTEMMQPQSPPRVRELGQRAARRMSIIFMIGNQLPILGLAEQQISPALSGAEPVRIVDPLQRFLALRRQQMPAPKSQLVSKLAVVAFTDPNDLLSYRLLPSRYAAPDVLIADVLVSNAQTWLGLLEDPFAAHLDYLENPDVGAIIACGWPRSGSCK